MQRALPEQLPERMYSTGYDLRWRASRTYVADAGGQTVSFWAPRPPSGNYR